MRGRKFLDQRNDWKFLKKELCCVGHVMCVCVNVCMDEMWNSLKNSKPAFLLHRLLSVRNLVLLMLYRYALQVYKPPVEFIVSSGLAYLICAEMVRPFKC